VNIQMKKYLLSFVHVNTIASAPSLIVLVLKPFPSVHVIMQLSECNI
jgi:hypothetical protein